MKILQSENYKREFTSIEKLYIAFVIIIKTHNWIEQFNAVS